MCQGRIATTLPVEVKFSRGPLHQGMLVTTTNNLVFDTRGSPYSFAVLGTQESRPVLRPPWSGRKGRACKSTTNWSSPDDTSCDRRCSRPCRARRTRGYAPYSQWRSAQQMPNQREPPLRHRLDQKPSPPWGRQELCCRALAFAIAHDVAWYQATTLRAIVGMSALTQCPWSQLEGPH